MGWNAPRSRWRTPWIEGWLLRRFTRSRASTIRVRQGLWFSTVMAPQRSPRSISIPASTGRRRSLLWARVYQILTVPSSSLSVATGINGAGLIVGLYVDLAGVVRGFANNGGTFSNVDFPGASGTQVIGVNDAGQMVGDYFDAAGEHGFAHPAWGADRIRYQLEKDGIGPVPGRTSVYRALVRHGLVAAEQRRRRRADYRRWERGRPMELWQMDVVGGFHLSNGVELKAVSGIDDNSRFAVSAKLVPRATAKPVCDALLAALRRHGIPEQLLTDNGRVFTGRFGPAGSSAEVLFDRICAENGLRHLLTVPRSPTTTGKVERWHKTIRAEFLRDHDHQHAILEELQAAWTSGSRSTTLSGRTRRWGCGRRSNGSSSRRTSPPVKSW